MNREKVGDKDIATASGAALFIPRTIIEKIGLFDEDFFMYSEDLDLSWRARMAGYNIKLVANALVWHDYSFSRNSQKMYLSERNRWLFLLKNFELKTLIIIAPMLVLNELPIIIFALAQGWLPQKLLSYWSILDQLPKTIRKRKEINQIRVKTDRDLKKWLGSEINFSEFHLPLISLYNGIVSLYWKLFSPLI